MDLVWDLYNSSLKIMFLNLFLWRLKEERRKSDKGGVLNLVEEVLRS